MRLVATAIPIVLGALLSAGAPVSMDPIVATLCTLDAMDDSPLVGSTIEATPLDAPTVSGVTDASGCVTLTMGVTTTATEGEIFDRQVFAGSPFPNPTSDALTLPVRVADGAYVARLYDALGRSLFETEIHAGQGGWYDIDVDARGLAPGAYFYSIVGEGLSDAGSFVKIGAPSSAAAVAVNVRKAAPRSQAPRLSLQTTSALVTEIRATRADYVTVETQAVIDSGETVELLMNPQASENAMIPLDRVDLYSEGDTYFGHPYRWSPRPAPAAQGSAIVVTGYSNWVTHGDVFISEYQGAVNPTIINCSEGGNALENWLTTSKLWTECVADVQAAGLSAADVAVMIHGIAHQTESSSLPAPDAGVYRFETELQDFADLAEQYFPNANNHYSSGEPAHFVASGKCVVSRICEPVRYDSAFGLNLAMDAIAADNTFNSFHTQGPYLWSGIGIPNASGIEFVPDDYLGVGGNNQHTSPSGDSKVAFIMDAFLFEHYGSWYR